VDNREQVRTTSRVLTHEEVQTALAEGILSLEEELLVRMRYGINLGSSDQLDFRGQNHDESRIKLAMMEKALLDEADSHGSTGDILSLLED
jgi:hypothetical protein